MSKRPNITCRTCHGSGETPLSDEYMETLSVVKRLPGKSSADFLAALPHVKMAALCNRLTDLMQMGFVTRERKGKFYYYTAVK